MTYRCLTIAIIRIITRLSIFFCLFPSLQNLSIFDCLLIIIENSSRSFNIMITVLICGKNCKIEIVLVATLHHSKRHFGIVTPGWENADLVDEWVAVADDIPIDLYDWSCCWAEQMHYMLSFDWTCFVVVWFDGGLEVELYWNQSSFYCFGFYHAFHLL